MHYKHLLKVEVERSKHFLPKMGGNGVTSENLVMLLDGGPGGGKTAVVSEFLKYGEQYCSFIGEPFTDRTVLVTAYPGDICASPKRPPLCSALSLFTSTQHVHASNKRHFQYNVKMVIVDEMSAYCASDMYAFDKRLRWFMDKSCLPFGGVDIIFVGNVRAFAPVRNKTFYKGFLSCINCYISLYQLPPVRDCTASLADGLRPFKKQRFHVTKKNVKHCRRGCVPSGQSSIAPLNKTPTILPPRCLVCTCCFKGVTPTIQQSSLNCFFCNVL